LKLIFPDHGPAGPTIEAGIIIAVIPVPIPIPIVIRIIAEIPAVPGPIGIPAKIPRRPGIRGPKIGIVVIPGRVPTHDPVKP
jgi:hypothetical protein